MGILDRIFGRGKGDKQQEAREESVETQPKRNEPEETERPALCQYCGFAADGKLGKLRSWGGMKWHKRCLRKFRKGVRRKA